MCLVGWSGGWERVSGGLVRRWESVFSGFVMRLGKCVWCIGEVVGDFRSKALVECHARANFAPELWRNAARKRISLETCGGMPRASEKIPIRAGGLFLERRLVGCVYGGADPRRDIPRLLDHVRDGSFRLDPLVSEELPLSGVAKALDALQEGRGARHVIVHGD